MERVPKNKNRLKGNPKASSEQALRRMKRQRQQATKPEIALQEEFDRHGISYRTNCRIIPGLVREADIAFDEPKVAILLDGCFWHACPLHATWPKNNAKFWKQKIEQNQKRDRNTNKKFTKAGWLLVRVWEHDDISKAAIRILEIIQERFDGNAASQTVYLSANPLSKPISKMELFKENQPCLKRNEGSKNQPNKE